VLLLGAGLAAAVALRDALGGSDPVSSTPATLLFACALLIVAAAAGGVRLRPPSTVHLAVGVVGGVALVAASRLGRPFPLMLHPPPGPELVAWSALLALVATAEEALLRGALFVAAERRWGTLAALLLSTAAFGLMHVPFYGWAALPLDLAAGLWLGGLRVLTGGVTAPAAAHTVADLAAVWAT
jgi:membrane protease YdiL (CAAX protease family)